MSSVEDLLNEALKLPYKQRADLVDRLYWSLHPPGEDISREEWEQAWAKEIQRRIAEADRGEFAEGDWRDVIERLRGSLQDTRRS